MKICFTVASSKALKELNIIVDPPCYRLLGNINLLHRCLIGDKI